MVTSDNTYICTVCGWVYDPAQGDPDGGIPPGTPWEDIPDDWICPVCGMSKEDFELEQASESAPASSDVVTAGKAALVIVGSGLAGYTLAKEVRKQDSECPLVIITADGGEVYTKPMLSNAFARHHQADDMVQKDAVTMAAELNAQIKIRTQLLAIDRESRSLTLNSDQGQESLTYDRLVLALGADPRIFPVEGADAVPIATVNDLDDYRRWREQIGESGRILLIGAGLIGCEFANDLAIAKFDVVMVDPSPWPLARLLPKEIGGMLVDALGDIGCDLYMGRSLSRYLPADKGFVAELDDGSQIAFDHALSAVGLVSRTALAKQAGLEVKSGVVVDRLMRTSDPAIFALGDCAQTEAGPLPFIAPLLAEAKALAATLAGKETPLQLPAMPVTIKTPALPLVVCPPPMGAEGSWQLESDEKGAVALFLTPEGAELGFALAGDKTHQQQTLAKKMPELLPAIEKSTATENKAKGEGTAACYVCTVCGHVYDPAEGDPDSGIPPGTPWEAIPDDWICPVCGVGKEDFSREE